MSRSAAYRLVANSTASRCAAAPSSRSMPRYQCVDPRASLSRRKASRPASGSGASANHPSSARCWGDGSRGRLGYASATDVGDDEAPGSVGPVDLGAGRTAVAIAAGGAHTCARLDDGNVRCWGEGAGGRLGYCNESAVGDDEAPGSVDPVELGVADGRGERCAPADAPPTAAAPEPTHTPAAGPSAPPMPPGGEDLVERDPLAAEARRARRLRGCRVEVARRAQRERRRGRHGTRNRPARARRRALRRIARRAGKRRRRCARRFGRTPGRVRALRARAFRRRVVLRFRAPGSDGSRPPAARAYLVKQSRRRMRNDRDFRRARALCGGKCRFSVTEVAAAITLTVTDLRRHRTYHYAVAARDNVSGRLGRPSRTVTAKTR